MSNKPKYDGPFEFPNQILEQVAECSKDGAFLLFYKDADGMIIPVMNAHDQTNSLALVGFAHNYLTALNNIDVGSLIDMFRQSMNEHLGVEGMDEEDDED